MEEKNNYQISMPHRHTVLYEEELEVKFETELAIDGIIFYRNSGKIVKGETDNLDLITDKVIKWLKEDRFKSKVHVDDS